ncbi:MAG: hypothetical protein ACD_79C00693G0001, partial [uncultured bacterium]
RPILCLLSAELFAEPSQNVINCACALELLHTYTLIHDDLPCMDNDDFRRGKPTCHKAFPESIALLAGDALLTLCFQIIADNTKNCPEKGIRIISDLAELTGSKGVIGGQVLDIINENKPITPEELSEIHINKTAKLISASVRMGAILMNAAESELEMITKYGLLIGEAFQIADDILDEIGDSAKLGKNTGQDLKLNKSTFPKFFGIDKSKQILFDKINSAVACLNQFGKKAESLNQIAHFIGTREN